MGVKYLTAYADSLVGDPSGAVRDLDRIPPFDAAACARTSTSNVVVLDASGGLARYLKPDDSERNLFDFQDMWHKVRSDVAAFRSLGYRLVAFLDATVPTAKLPVWKQRRRQEYGRLLKLTRAVESESPGPPSWPKDAFAPPESGLQALADAFASAGCEVHLGLDDVDSEAAAFCRASRAFAVLTCDSDFFVADLGAATVRVWHWEHLGPSWGRQRQGRQQQQQHRGSAASASPSSPSPSSPSSAPAPALPPALSVREYRVDRLRARLRLGARDMPLLAACLGNDGVPHITRSQLERVLAEHPVGAAAAVAAASASPSFGGGGRGRGGGGGGRGGYGGRGRGGFSSGPPPWRVVELVAHELARQLAAGLIPGAAAADATAATTATATAPHPDTARFVSGRVLAHHRAVRDAYAPASEARPPNSFRPAGAGTAPNVVRAVIARHGVMVKAQRSDDVREPPVTTAVKELRMRVYAGCGIRHVRELLYHPIGGRGGGGAGASRAAPPPPLVPPPRSSGGGNNNNDGPLGETRSLLEALPALGGNSGGGFEDESRLVWQEGFVDVDVQAELEAPGSAPPLLPSSPEVAAASKNGEALVEFAAQELLRLELITPVEAELLKRQASPRERASIRQQAGAEPLRRRGDRWSGQGGVVCCMRSVRVATLLITVHTWVAALLDNIGMPSIESCLDVRVFNELWRREVERLEQEEQPKGAAQRWRWVREGAPPPSP